jgi:subtilisin family serine protease
VFRTVRGARRSARTAGLVAALLVTTAMFGSGVGLAEPADGTIVADGGPGAVRGAPASIPESPNGIYIVELSDPPVVAYDGGLPGLRSTRPAAGRKVNPNDPDVVRYVRHLDGRQSEAVERVGGRPIQGYQFAYNGVAAELTPGQAARLAADPQVVAVTPDTLLQPDTSTSPSFLGLDAENGIWAALSGNAGGNPIAGTGPSSSGAGEGVVVGIVDSGIWPEHPSFSDRNASGQRVYRQIRGWNGRCVPGERFRAADCNQKLIAAQWYGAGWGGAAGIKDLFPYEFVSARAADGHGVHVAATAAGNYGVTASAEGIDLGTVSGVAPRARVATYKVCWGIAPEGGCFGSDSVAAIDQAVADGVDVINFSISGTRTNFRDPVEIAFLFAEDAGVFVAASAGNSGPGASTVAHPSPWITTVAASTQSRTSIATATLGNGNSYVGASLTAAVGPAPLVYSGDVGLDGANATQVQLCYPGTLDPAKVTGTIVVCDRDVIARTDKSLAVQQAGGVGMILVNRSPSSINADLHYVPTVHVNNDVRAEIIAYAQTDGATASLNASVTTNDGLAPTMASFSSRGPLIAGDGNLLKPDITAPGVDILAAYSPVANGRTFDFLSGTSMSSPHIAGVAALMRDLHPTWSPTAIKSALMTTAYQTTRTGTPGQVFGTPFSFGAGHVDPNPAMNPGLVFEAGFGDYLGFLCGTQLPVAFCDASGVPVLAPSDLNVPSIAVGALAGSRTIPRTVTNVSGTTATFTGAASGLTGITVTSNPASFTLAPGASQTVEVTLTNVGAPLNTYANGAVTWTSDQGHSVRIPVVARPVAFAAPVSVSGDGSPISYDVTFGYNGPFAATASGLTAAMVTPGTVTQDPDQTFDPADPTGTVTIPVEIPAGTTYTRFALFDEDVAPDTDLDLYVYQGATLVGASTSGTSAEEINFSFANPTGGPIPLTVYVHGWGVPAGSSPFVLHEFYVPGTAAGNMEVTAPTEAILGETSTIELSFGGLEPGTRYLGRVAYSGAAGMPAPTLVTVRTP